MIGDQMGKVAYDDIFSLCDKAFGRYGGILDLPVARQPYEYIREEYKKNYPGGKVLDFGCGAKKPLRRFAGIPDDLYYSCDEDQSAQYSYDKPSGIPDDHLFDIIFANQVFEHLQFDNCISTAKILSGHLKPGGIFLISVPNTSHPVRFLSSPFHITPLNHMYIYAIMEIAGLDPSYCARYNKKPAPKWYIRPMINVICRTFRIDWCDSVFVIGRR
ncbi:hypothetical protein MNBD_NITROSPINAE02-1775 [hydrothermal vent metagenome]|uniref:Methyltransferase type 11 domain-containing protein n=1 Tax=hydrothermal vent metagenome TaxID=652676 RepID=A0A3B1C6L5_9ZZZZ